MTWREQEDHKAELAMTEEAFEERLKRHDPLASGVFAAMQGALARLPDHEHRAFVNYVVRGIGEDYEDGKFDIGGGEHPPWRRDADCPVHLRTWEAIRAAAKPGRLVSGHIVWHARPTWYGVCPPRGEIPRILARPGKPWPPVPGELPETFATEAEAFAALDRAIAAAGRVQDWPESGSSE